jgi:hypothetical protein
MPQGMAPSRSHGAEEPTGGIIVILSGALDLVIDGQLLMGLRVARKL